MPPVDPQELVPHVSGALNQSELDKLKLLIELLIQRRTDASEDVVGALRID